MLVRKKGPRGFSLNEASRLAGVTVAAPYRHFEDKDALLAEIICDGNAILEKEVREAAGRATDTRAQMLEAGMAYLRFAARHADYFAVIFNSGLDKSRYPEVQRSARAAFSVILELAQKTEPDAQRAWGRAVSAWAFVHGLATLSGDEAIIGAADEGQEQEQFRRMLREFVEKL